MIRKSIARCIALFSFGALQGCGSVLGDCPSGSDTQQSAGAQIVTSQCATCHSSALSGAARAGAPTGYDFDTSAGVQAHAEEMYEQAEAGKMPKAGPLSATDLENLRIYLSCTVN